MQLADTPKQLPPSDLQVRPLQVANGEMQERSELHILRDRTL